MESRATVDLLKAWALEAGFDRAGVARLDPLEHGEALVRWLDRGDQAGMGYLGRRLEARLDPSQVFPGARSVLCVALQYHPLERVSKVSPAGAPGISPGRKAREGEFDAIQAPVGAAGSAGPAPAAPTGAQGCGNLVPPGLTARANSCRPCGADQDTASSRQELRSREDGERQPEPPGDLWRRVARYARGRDYHDVMGERLRTLEERVRAELPGCETRRYVDTGPVLERELAARAGMGAVGKNTMLLHPEGGSWFLLGELFLSLDIDPGPVRPIEDLCGSCTLCLDACPTGALAEPYRLDANRCISYWTIEHRGALPAEARRMVGGWVFGCDVCQEVCPWNAAPAPAVHPEMELPPERGELTLARLLGLPREEYVERFRGSPMKRAKLEGLQRNAAVAMGNRRESRHVGPLAAALRDGAPLVRGHAAWALGRIGGDEAAAALEAALADEGEEAVREEIRAALTPPPLRPILGGPSSQ
jgi:epoxyqueuosine reductase